MAPPGPLSRLGSGVVAATLAIAGCGGSDQTSSSTTTDAHTAPPGTSEMTTATSTTTEQPAVGTVDLYFTAGEQFEKVERPLPRDGQALEAVTEELLRGPRVGDAGADVALRSQIPDGVRLTDVSRDADGAVTVEVSEDFDDGLGGEKPRPDQRAELNARLGQLTYTLTQLEGVESVQVLAGGRPVEPPVERADYARPAKGPARQQRSRPAKSVDARRLQQRLAQLRFLPRSAVDGIAGYRTQQAVIAFQSWNGLARDGIVGPATAAALARAHRPQPGRKGPARRIEVYRDKGVALLIEHGRTRRAIHVSSGAPGTPTPSGTYAVFRKELRSWSVPFQTWLPYASYFNQGIAFHEYPDVPTHPASHGCVRVPSPEAEGVYEFASIGTAVVVH